MLAGGICVYRIPYVTAQPKMHCWQPTRMKRMNHPNNPFSSGWKVFFLIISVVFASFYWFLLYFPRFFHPRGPVSSARCTGCQVWTQMLRIPSSETIGGPGRLDACPLLGPPKRNMGNFAPRVAPKKANRKFPPNRAPPKGINKEINYFVRNCFWGMFFLKKLAWTQFWRPGTWKFGFLVENYVYSLIPSQIAEPGKTKKKTHAPRKPYEKHINMGFQSWRLSVLVCNPSTLKQFISWQSSPFELRR